MSSGFETAERRLRVLVLARSYPSDVLPALGLWIERPTVHLGRLCDVRVVSPVPYFPPLPRFARLRSYSRFRDVVPSEIRNGISVHRPRFVVGPGDTLYRFEAKAYELGVARTAMRLHEQRPFDLIHAHFVFPDGVVAHRLARRLGIPFVLTEHAPWIPWLERPGIAAPALRAGSAAARIMAVSTYVRDGIAAYIGESNRLEVLPLCLEEDVFHLNPRMTRARNEILYVGQINVTKGIDILLHAMRALVDRGHPASLRLVGGTYYQRRQIEEERLRALATELSLGDRVTFLGMLPPTHVAALMRTSAVVVLPSRAESFGSVLIEAIACGTPVVATRSGGPEDIVTESVGRLVPPEDPGLLAEAIADVLSTPESFPPEDLAAYAVERYGAAEIVRRTLDAYRSAVRSAAG